MGLSKKFSEKLQSYSEEDIARLVRMGWEDRSTFDAIFEQFDLTPNQFVKFMRSRLPANDFQRWRRRIFEQGHLKNEKTRGFTTTRFKCSRQADDGLTKGWK